MTKSQRMGIAFPVTALPFAVANIADSQTGTAIPADTQGNVYVMPWAGRIVGVSAALNAAITAGVITVKPAVNGTADATAAAVLNTSNTQFISSKAGRVGFAEFAAGDRIGLVYDSDANVEANTVDLVGLVFVAFDDADF